MKYAILLLLSAGAHAQTLYYIPTQCGPGGCQGGACQPRYYYQQQPQYVQPRQQSPSPDGVQTLPVTSPNAPKFQPLPPPTPITTPPIPPQPPVKSCDCGPKWVAINLQIAKMQEDMQAQVTAVGNLATVVNEIKDRKTPVVPTMDEIAEAMKSRLQHSATVTLLDGSVTTQTKPLSEPLEFNQHRVGVK
jgi:hypothetical protein